MARPTLGVDRGQEKGERREKGVSLPIPPPCFSCPKLKGELRLPDLSPRLPGGPREEDTMVAFKVRPVITLYLLSLPETSTLWDQIRRLVRPRGMASTQAYREADLPSL